MHDVAGTLDVDSLLSQTQVLWLTFESIAQKDGADPSQTFPEELRALLP